MKKSLITLTLLGCSLFFLIPLPASSQVHTPISSLSEWHCATLPNGNRRAARFVNGTWRYVHPNRADNLIQRDIRGLQNRIRNVNRIRQRLVRQRRQGKGIGELTAQQLERVKRFLLEGEIQGDFPDEIELQIEKLERIRERFREMIAFRRLERRSLRQCRTRRYFPVELYIQHYWVIPSPGYQGQPAGSMRSGIMARLPLRSFGIGPSEFGNVLVRWICLEIPERSSPLPVLVSAHPCSRHGVNNQNSARTCDHEVLPRNNRGFVQSLAGYTALLNRSGRTGWFGQYSNSRTMEELMMHHEVEIRKEFAGLTSARAKMPRRQEASSCADVKF